MSVCGFHFKRRPASRKSAITRYVKAISTAVSVETAVAGRWPALVDSFTADAHRVRAEILAQYPDLADELEEFIPTDYTRKPKCKQAKT